MIKSKSLSEIWFRPIILKINNFYRSCLNTGQHKKLWSNQEIRIKHRWEAMDAENDTMENAGNTSTKYTPELLRNEDTLKQLLARSRYLLNKSSSKWI